MAPDSDMNTPLAVAIKYERWEIFYLLLSKFCVEKPLDVNSVIAIKSNDLTRIKQTLQHRRWDIATMNSALLVAASLRNWSALDAFLTHPYFRKTSESTRSTSRDQALLAAAILQASESKQWSAVEDLARVIQASRKYLAPSTEAAVSWTGFFRL